MIVARFARKSSGGTRTMSLSPNITVTRCGLWVSTSRSSRPSPSRVEWPLIPALTTATSAPGNVCLSARASISG